MIRVDTNEYFPVSICLLDETTGQYVSGRSVNYVLRTVGGSTVSSGTFTESVNDEGVYKTSLNISSSGNYIFYATSSGFLTTTEDIVVNEESVYELVKQNRHYNISVEDVIRTDDPATASQAARNVPLNKTDYIVTKIKPDTDSDWSGSVVSGTVYAWYASITDEVPYKMGGDGV